ncbi:uncharacterized protein LOC131957174 [Physella acuta]|uniref:uncharacterized protein LOC131957174 n=1 Tax=Physella acuta TaxID=109671 RepID=UPI0027DC607D|nr:uncharacterized protein LOC131957174 [Physella acuta]
MNQVQLSLFAALFALLLVTLTQSSPLPDALRIRRSAADQRIAELQAQAALRQPKNRNMIGYGLYDIDAIGKKKRDPQFVGVTDEERYNLLKALLQRAAIENSAS